MDASRNPVVGRQGGWVWVLAGQLAKRGEPSPSSSGFAATPLHSRCGATIDGHACRPPCGWDSAVREWGHLKWSEDLSQIGHWLLEANMITVLVGISFYSICRALGWIVVGFTRK